MLLVSYIQQYFNTSITVLTNQVWKLLIALFKVPNTGAFMVLSSLKECFVKKLLEAQKHGMLHQLAKHFSASTDYKLFHQNDLQNILNFAQCNKSYIAPPPS